MKLLRMTAVFGKLDGETLTLTEGLNLITLPNEGGKSTWCAFLRAMLYGIPTRERDREGYIAEKNRYQPWSGKPPEGEIDLIWNDRAITLRRATRGSTPFGVFEAVYTDSGEPVPGLKRETVGEMLTGVTRDVFERTAFIGQGMIAVTAAPDLERRCAALLLSGEEDVSFSEAELRLRNWRNARKSNAKTGAIPKLELARAELRDTLAHLEHARDRRSAALEEIALQSGRCAALEHDIAAHRAAHRAERRARYEQALAQLQACEDAERALPPAQALPPEPPQRSTRGRPGLTIVAVVLLCLALLNLYRAVAAPDPIWWIAAGLTAVCSGGAMLLSRITAAREEVAHGDALRAYEQAVRTREGQDAARTAAMAETARARAVVETMERDGVPEPTDGPPPPSATAEESNYGYRVAAAALEQARRDLAAAEGEMRALGDPAELEGQLEELRERLAALRRDYDALTLAAECLESAGSALRERFSPRLNAEAGRILSVLTGGAWDGITLTREFAARTTRPGEVTPRAAGLLSRGTVDQLYLAVRLALCNLTLDGAVPIVLDDALSAFDDTRLAATLAFLRSSGRQVLLFSCQGREAALR